jgi:hypothetical protein
MSKDRMGANRKRKAKNGIAFQAFFLSFLRLEPANHRASVLG